MSPAFQPTQNKLRPAGKQGFVQDMLILSALRVIAFDNVKLIKQLGHTCILLLWLQL